MRRTIDPKDLLFDPEIEKTAKANRKATKARKQAEQRATTGESSVQTLVTEIMAEPPPPPRRTLGDFGARNQGVQAYTFQPVGAVAFEIKSSILNALKSEQFSGSDAEDPNQHLFQFYEICGSTNPPGVTEDQKKLRLFPYTLTGRAKDWLNTIPAGTVASWSDLESKFLERFFPISKFIKKRAEISNYEQRDSESLYDAWERFKLLLKRCPGHGIDDFVQLQTFCHGLRPQTRMMLDASAGGSLGTRTADEARELVEHMASNEYKIQNDRGATVKKGMLELDSNSAVLAQQKVMSLQLEALTKQLAAALPGGSQAPATVQAVHSGACNYCGREAHEGDCATHGDRGEQVNYMGNFQKQGGNPYSNTYNPGWKNHPNFSWKNNDTAGPSQQQQPQPSYQQHNNPSQVEEALTQFMQMSRTTFLSQEQAMKNMEKNHQASLKNLEVQIGQLSKQLAESSSSGFSANTVDNPKRETANAITLRSGRELKTSVIDVEKKGESGKKNKNNGVVENELSKKSDGGVKSNHDKNNSVIDKNLQVQEDATVKETSKLPKPIIKLPYPQRVKKEQDKNQFGKFLDVFKKLQINIPFAEALEQMPKYAKFMKDILSKKRNIVDEEKVMLSEECSAILQRKLPQKLKDPGSFSIPCSIGDMTFKKALCDLGASINLMPLSIFEKLGIGDGQLKDTKMTLHMADRSVRYPWGVVEDVLVKIDKFIFPVDFVVLDIDEDDDIPLILGRPFLATAKAVIRVADGTLTFEVEDEVVTFNVLNTNDSKKESSPVITKAVKEGIVTKKKEAVAASVDPPFYAPLSTPRKKQLQLERKSTLGTQKEAPEKQSPPPDPS